MKKFNIAGVCIKEKHYMVDTTDKIKKIEMMIEDGAYFTINRSRQFGKTTTISMIGNNILDKYIILKASFEGTGESLFEDEATFCSNIIYFLSQSIGFCPLSFSLSSV